MRKFIFYIFVLIIHSVSSQNTTNYVNQELFSFCNSENFPIQQPLNPAIFNLGCNGNVDTCIGNAPFDLTSVLGNLLYLSNINNNYSSISLSTSPVYVELIQPLIIDCEYKLLYKVKSKSPPNCDYQQFDGFADHLAFINNISALFSNKFYNEVLINTVVEYEFINFLGDSIITHFPANRNHVPHQINFQTSPIDDVWHIFNQNFVADSSYQRLFIGFFDSIQELTPILEPFNSYYGIDSLGFEEVKSYNFYYIFDEISLFPIGYEELTLYLEDTSLCHSSNIAIDASHPDFTSYLWSTGDTTSSIEISSPGTYWLRADYACGYLTDTFTVHPAPVLNFDSLFHYPDTFLICPSELPFTLSLLDSIGAVNWSTGDFAESIVVQSEGLYIASYENCDTIVDSVWVILLELENIELFSFTDTTVCNEISIAVANTFQTYLWSNGITSNEATFTESGTYTLTVNDGCFDYTDSFNLVIDQLVAGAFAEHRHYCPQDFPVTLSVSSFDQPLWNTGEQSPCITLNSPQSGTFIHTSENTCGVRSDTFHIHLQTDTLSQWPQINIEEQCIEQGLYYIITQVFDDNFNYQWDGQTSLNFSTTGGSTETLTISNECASFSIDTALSACPERIVFALPTAFSPNSDGVNDQFGLLYLRDDYVLFKLQVFNRWGELVFVSENIQNKWNGFYKDKPAPIGVYIYQLLIVSNDGEEELHSGNVTLAR